VDVLVVDELSKMKHVSTARYKSLHPYLHKFARRWGLTGSPASNGLHDLFGQVFTIDLGKVLGQFITHFRNRFFYPTGYGGYTWALQEGAADKIYAAIKPLALTMQAEDYLELPKIIPITIYVDLPPAARKMYDKMEDEMFAELEDEKFIAATAAAASMKCEQIANGALYKDKVDPETGLPVGGKREWAAIHNAKLDALEEVLGELQGQPSLWGYHFHHDLDRIVKLLGKDTPHCAHSPKIVDGLFKKWNRNELPYLFGHPASIGHGNNLQEGDCCHVGLFSVPWDYDIYSQFIQRVKRQGNKAKNVFVYHIIARGTVDEAKMAAMHRKAKGQQELLDALKTYRRSKLRG
jgi:SNF2 family DNA or RNA helicase